LSETEDSAEVSLALLERCLYIGTSRTCYKPANDGKLGMEELSMLKTLVESGHTTLPLETVIKAYNQGNANRTALFYAMNLCMKVTNPSAKAAAYAELGKLNLTPEDFLDLMAYHYMANKPSHGMGKGMRKFIQRWYSSQSPHEFAISTARIKKKGGWSHKDIIRMARVKSDNPAMDAVLMACVRGVAHAQDHFKDKIETQQTLDYLACYKSFAQCTDPSTAVQMIKTHSFDIDMIPSELLQYPQVWVAAIEQSPLHRVLFHLKAMTLRGTLAKDTSPVLNQVIELFQVPLALKTSNLQPSQILLYHHLARAGWQHPPVRSKAAKEKKMPSRQLQLPGPKLLTELNDLMKGAFKNVPKMPDKKVLVIVDTRQSMRTSPCWQAWVVPSAEAASMTCLSLVASGCEVTLTTILPKERWESIPLSSADDMKTLCKKMMEAEGGVSDPVVISSQVKYDMIISISDKVGKVVKKRLWEDLQAYRDQLGINSRFVYLATSSSSVKIANPADNQMLDIAGWTPQVVQVLLAYLAEDF